MTDTYEDYFSKLIELMEPKPVPMPQPLAQLDWKDYPAIEGKPAYQEALLPVSGFQVSIRRYPRRYFVAFLYRTYYDDEYLSDYDYGPDHDWTQDGEGDGIVPFPLTIHETRHWVIAFQVEHDEFHEHYQSYMRALVRLLDMLKSDGYPATINIPQFINFLSKQMERGKL